MSKEYKELSNQVLGIIGDEKIPSQSALGKIIKDAANQWYGVDQEKTDEFVESFSLSTLENGPQEDERERCDAYATYGSYYGVGTLGSIIPALEEISFGNSISLISDIAGISDGSQLKEAAAGIDAEKTIDILKAIHNNWVVDNGKKYSREGKSFMFMPLELLPYDEVEKDLLFVSPILESAGINVEAMNLEETFNEKQETYFISNEISDKESLAKHIKQVVSKSYEPLQTTQFEGKDISTLVDDRVVDDVIGALGDDKLEQLYDTCIDEGLE